MASSPSEADLAAGTGLMTRLDAFAVLTDEPGRLTRLFVSGRPSAGRASLNRLVRRSRARLIALPSHHCPTEKSALFQISRHLRAKTPGKSAAGRPLCRGWRNGGARHGRRRSGEEALAAVHYQPAPKDRKQCGGCNFFIAPCAPAVAYAAQLGARSDRSEYSTSSRVAPRARRGRSPGWSAAEQRSSRQK
jgi:hypothetical protein